MKQESPSVHLLAKLREPLLLFTECPLPSSCLRLGRFSPDGLQASTLPVCRRLRVPSPHPAHLTTDFPVLPRHWSPRSA